MRSTNINEPSIQGSREQPALGEEGGAWSFPPLLNPPRSAQQLVLSHGEFTAAGWLVGWAQIIGSRHSICEDSMAVRLVSKSADTDCGLMGIHAALGDGVGGGARGDVASNAGALHCVHYSSESYSIDEMPSESLRSWLLQSDHVVTQAVRAVASQPGASTLAATWLDPNGLGWVSRVGDARVYLISRTPKQSDVKLTHPKWQARLLLPDQTYAFLGELPPSPDLAEEPARMVGAGLIGNPEVVPITVGGDDTLVLCSDGLHRFLDAENLAALSGEGAEPDAVACAMVSLARARGSDDDISVLILRRRHDECFVALAQQADD